VTAKIQRSS